MAGDGDYKPGDLIRAAQDYVVVKALGAGGMGSVYLAKHRVLYRPFVLKLLHAEHFHRAELIEMFEAEARTVARLGEPEPHPGIIEVVDLGRTKDRGCMPYMVMPYLVGETLSAALERRNFLTVLESIGLVTRILQALDHAHRRGVVHRDVKPENIFIPQVSEGIAVKVLDWGISKLVAQARDPHMFLGTPAWASKEQILGHGIGPLSDVYSAGAVLFRCLTGRMPFAELGGGYAELRRAVDAPAPRITDFGDFPPSLGNLVALALAKDSSHRPVDALAFATALQEIGDGVRRQQPSAPPSHPVRYSAPSELITEANIAGLTIEDPEIGRRMRAERAQAQSTHDDGGMTKRRTQTTPMQGPVAARRATAPMRSSPSASPAPVSVIHDLPPRARPPWTLSRRASSVIAVLLVGCGIVLAVWTIARAPESAATTGGAAVATVAPVATVGTVATATPALTVATATPALTVATATPALTMGGATDAAAPVAVSSVVTAPPLVERAAPVASQAPLRRAPVPSASARAAMHPSPSSSAKRSEFTYEF